MDNYCLQVLAEIIMSGSGVTYNELWRRTKMAKKTFHKHLYDLIAEGYVQREEQGKQRMRFTVKDINLVANYLREVGIRFRSSRLLEQIDDGKPLISVVSFLSLVSLVSCILYSAKYHAHRSLYVALSIGTLWSIVEGCINRLQENPKLRIGAVKGVLELFDRMEKELGGGVTSEEKLLQDLKQQFAELV